jgi:ribA/ribD-fused uncharacterized protein
METDTAIYFYGHVNRFGFLSNFYPCEFKIKCTVDNEKCTIQFNCSEQYFMYKKCMLFDKNNTLLIHKILSATVASKIKAFGRQVLNFDNEIWSQHKCKIMLKALKYKFGQNDDLMSLLQSTKGKMLYEASSRDKVWGIGISLPNAINVDPSLYGENLLGSCLVKIRDGQ